MNSLKYIPPQNPGTGLLGLNVAILGEAPGALEEQQGIPFVGKSGQLLRKALKELDINPDLCYIDNCMNVRPPDNRTPTDEELESWKPHLLSKLKSVNPKVIVAVGNCAIKTLLGFDTDIKSIRGTLVEYELNGRKCVVLPVYHPSYILRTGQYQLFKEQLKLIHEGKSYFSRKGTL